MKVKFCQQSLWFLFGLHDNSFMHHKRRHDTQHKDTQHEDIQHNDTQHEDIQHNDTQHEDIQHNNKWNMTLRKIAVHCYAECH